MVDIFGNKLGYLYIEAVIALVSLTFVLFIFSSGVIQQAEQIESIEKEADAWLALSYALERERIGTLPAFDYSMSSGKYSVENLRIVKDVSSGQVMIELDY